MRTSSTRALTDELVERLRERAAPAAEADKLWSLCVCGSYARGDFMDHNSDLDLVLIGRPGAHDCPSGSSVRDLIAHMMGGRRLYSHNPHQFDWVTLPWNALPKPGETISLPESGPSIRLLNIFLFDFIAHLEVLWGEDPREALAEPPEVRDLAPAWFRRARNNHQLHLAQHTEFRIPMGAFNSIQVAQIIFGKRTLDKRELLHLYQTYVPDFSRKDFGCWMIQNKLDQCYPDHPAEVAPWAHYIEFENQLADIVGTDLSISH